MPYDRSPMILGNRIPYGRGSLEGAEPPYDDGFPHGRIGPEVPGDAGIWVIVPADVPYDGRYYVRQNRDWIVTTFLDPLPSDLSSIWGRKRHLAGPDTWERVVGEAPADNRTYARENGVWVPIPPTFPDAPVDARCYGRSGGIWVFIPPEAPTNITATYAYARRDGSWWEVPLELENVAIGGVPYGRVRLGDVTTWARVVPEAPLNTTLYGRQNGSWVAIAPSGVGEAPSDNYHYGRFNQTWAEVIGEVPEFAPVGKTYARSHRLWLEVPRDVTVNTEGLDDGVYVRRKVGTIGSWVPAPTPPEDAPINAVYYARRGTPVTDQVPSWQPVPIQDDALVNDNIYGRRNRQWQEVPEEVAASVTVPQARRHHQWVPIVIGDPWVVMPFFTPSNWTLESVLRYRNVGGSQVEFVGQLVPTSPIESELIIGQPLGASRTSIEQRVIVCAATAEGPIKPVAIRCAPNTGMMTIQTMGFGTIYNIAAIHFVIALN